MFRCCSKFFSEPNQDELNVEDLKKTDAYVIMILNQVVDIVINYMQSFNEADIKSAEKRSQKFLATEDSLILLESIKFQSKEHGDKCKLLRCNTVPDILQSLDTAGDNTCGMHELLALMLAAQALCDVLINNRVQKKEALFYQKNMGKIATVVAMAPMNYSNSAACA